MLLDTILAKVVGTQNERELKRLRPIVGEVGALDPLLAIEDGVRMFHPDEIVISTHPEGRSNWLERGVVQAARDRYDVPMTHVVVDLEAQTDK